MSEEPRRDIKIIDASKFTDLRKKWILENEARSQSGSKRLAEIYKMQEKEFFDLYDKALKRMPLDGGKAMAGLFAMAELCVNDTYKRINEGAAKEPDPKSLTMAEQDEQMRQWIAEDEANNLDLLTEIFEWLTYEQTQEWKKAVEELELLHNKKTPEDDVNTN